MPPCVQACHGHHTSYNQFIKRLCRSWRIRLPRKTNRNKKNNCYYHWRPEAQKLQRQPTAPVVGEAQVRSPCIESANLRGAHGGSEMGSANLCSPSARRRALPGPQTGPIRACAAGPLSPIGRISVRRTAHTPLALGPAQTAGRRRARSRGCPLSIVQTLLLLPRVYFQPA